MINTYLAFCKKFSCRPLDPTLQTMLSYLEHLAVKMKSPKTVMNYWSAVKLLHTLNKCSISRADDIEIQLMIKSISITKRHVSTQKSALDKQHIIKIATVLDKQGESGLVIKTAVLIGFFGFLRASNLCPKDATSFDPTRNFQRKDVKVTAQGLVVTLKWSKTMQSALQQTTIPLPQAQTRMHRYHDSICQDVPGYTSKPQ